MPHPVGASSSELTQGIYMPWKAAPFGADSARKSAPDSDDDEYWPGQGVERSTSSVLQTRSGNAHAQSKGAKYRHAPNVAEE